MKKIVFALMVTSMFIISCKTTDKKTDSPKITSQEVDNIVKDTTGFTTIQWLDSTNLTLAKVKEGMVVEVAYRFKNTGTKPLVISSVTASCGCTVPEKPEKPFAPGEEGEIKAKFDSKGRVGQAHKSIYVIANTNPTSSHELTFNVEVTNK